MPGLTAFNRRWSVGSDDFVLPGGILSLFHLICTVILVCVLCLIDFSGSEKCVLELWIFNVVYLSAVAMCLALEFFMSCVSYRGSILNTEPRSAVKYILYIRLGVLIAEIGILGYGVYWICINYHTCPVNYAKTVFLVLIVLNWVTVICIFFNIWCAYDPAGRSWVKMKAYQRSMKESESKFQYKRSGSTRNWRQRKVMKAYQDSWDQRCRLLFCCMRGTDTNRNSFREIARLLSDYFRDLDVVPSDVIAGIILLRIYQKIERRAIIEQRKNDTYEFLSGVPVTSNTKFLSLQEEGTDLELFQTVIRYVYFAVRAYGWPMYVMTKKMGLCTLCSNASCCCFMNSMSRSGVEVIEDNCCQLNRAALQTLSELGNIEIIYATYHVDIGKTPFFIALDYDREKVIISIRGTLSMKDILTDLNAEAETIPVDPIRDEWLGHKGMVTAAEYILEKIKSEKLLQRAHNYRTAIGTKSYGLVIVGHSLGAGIASILGILLRNEYPNLMCYCYSPPGGLLSVAAMEYTKAFTISVVLGKDVVPRLGLNQMEALRADLINAIKRSVDPKWKIISCGVMCCCCAIEPTSATELSTADQAMSDYIREKKQTRTVGGVHPSDSTIALTTHQPMYPPGRIIHVVRHHPTRDEKALAGGEPVYQAIWAENTDFDEVLISPVMIQDHMPDKLLTALNKVIITMGPKKPRRSNLNEVLREYQMFKQLNEDVPERSEPHNICLETCFTTFPDQQFNSVPTITSEPVLETTNFRHKQKDNGNLAILDKNKNLDILTTRHYSPKALCDVAPLAQPENFSDTSSSTSSTHNLDNVLSSSWTRQMESIPSPSILKAPQMMRRTPKIIGNLSTCTEDIRNVKSFEKLVKTGNAFLDNSNSSSNLSYTSGISNKTNCSNDYEHFVSLGQCSWQREQPNLKQWEAENVSGASKNSILAEELLEEILEYADCADFFKSDSSFLDGYDERLFDTESEANCDTDTGLKIPTIKLTKSTNPTTNSPLILSPCSLEIDPDLISNFAIDLNLEQEHRSLLSHQNLQTSILKVSHIGAYNGSHTPPCAKTVTFSPDVLSIDDRALLQGSCECLSTKQERSGFWNFIPFRYFSKKPKERTSSLPNITKTENVSTIYSNTEKKRSIDQLLTKNEALPLLNAARGDNTEQFYSNVFSKRKVCVNSEV